MRSRDLLMIEYSHSKALLAEWTETAALFLRAKSRLSHSETAHLMVNCRLGIPEEAVIEVAVVLENWRNSKPRGEA